MIVAYLLPSTEGPVSDAQLRCYYRSMMSHSLHPLGTGADCERLDGGEDDLREASQASVTAVMDT